MKLVREPRTGDIWCEVQARHNGVEVCSAFRLGPLWELLPRLATLA